MLSLQTVFLYPKDAKNQADQVRLRFAVHEGDHLTLLNGNDTIWYYTIVTVFNFIYQYIMGLLLTNNLHPGVMKDSFITSQWQGL